MLPPEWDAADWERAEVSWISSSWDLSRRLDPSKHSEEQSRAWPTFSIAVGAHGLHLLHHARGQLPDHDAHAPAPAGVALLNGAGLPSLPAAHSTGCIKRKFFRKKPETPCSSRLACQHARLHCPLQLGPLLSHPAPTQSPWIVPVPSTASFKFNNLLVRKQAPVSQILIKIWHRRSFITLSANKATRELKNTNKLTHYMHYKGHSC